MRARFGIHACLGNHDVATDAAHITAVLSPTESRFCETALFLSSATAQRLWLVWIG